MAKTRARFKGQQKKELDRAVADGRSAGSADRHAGTVVRHAGSADRHAGSDAVADTVDRQAAGPVAGSDAESSGGSPRSAPRQLTFLDVVTGSPCLSAASRSSSGRRVCPTDDQVRSAELPGFPELVRPVPVSVPAKQRGTGMARARGTGAVPANVRSVQVAGTGVVPDDVLCFGEQVQGPALCIGQDGEDARQVFDEMFAGEQGNAAASKAEQQVPAAPWADAFRDNRAPGSGLPLSHVETVGLECKFEKHEITPVKEIIGFSLIGYVAGRFPGRQAIRDCCVNWGCQFSIHESGWLIFRFKNEDDMNKVLEGGPYFVFQRPLLLKIMPPFFNFDNEEMCSFPVWVRLRALPFELWNAQCLSKILSHVGKPVRTDKLTQCVDRVSYARALVEVNATEELVKEVVLHLPNGETVTQEVTYEYVPKFCIACNSLGHDDNNCFYDESRLAQHDKRKRSAAQHLRRPAQQQAQVRQQVSQKAAAVQPSGQPVLVAAGAARQKQAQGSVQQNTGAQTQAKRPIQGKRPVQAPQALDTEQPQQADMAQLVVAMEMALAQKIASRAHLEDATLQVQPDEIAEQGKAHAHASKMDKGKGIMIDNLDESAVGDGRNTKKAKKKKIVLG